MTWTFLWPPGSAAENLSRLISCQKCCDWQHSVCPPRVVRYIDGCPNFQATRKSKIAFVLKEIEHSGIRKSVIFFPCLLHVLHADMSKRRRSVTVTQFPLSLSLCLFAFRFLASPNCPDSFTRSSMSDKYAVQNTRGKTEKHEILCRPSTSG